MNFVHPEYQTIYDTLKNNKSTIEHLTKIGALYTNSDYYNKFGYSTDTYAIEKYISYNNEIILSNLANLIYEHKDEIEKKSLQELYTSMFLADEIKYALGFDTKTKLTLRTIKELYYNYKTSYVDNFFKNNWEKFVPDCDAEKLKNNNFTNALIDSLMKEFDKLNNIITETKKFKSYREIPIEYLNYLSQLLGFEKKVFVLEDDAEEEFRTLAENIIDLYSYKGTYSTFELLFRFLGFNIKINQYYFDRRLFYLNENKESSESNKNSYRFYLTTKNPTENRLDFYIDEMINDSDLSPKLRLENFNELCEKYGVAAVLGYSDTYPVMNGDKIVDTLPYTGDVYKYFKTNLFKIIPSLFDTKENFSTSQLNTIDALLNFLVPEFWQRELMTTISQSSDEEGIVLTGRDYAAKYFEEDPNFSKRIRILDSEEYIIKNEDEIKEGTPEQKARLTNLKKDYLYDGDRSSISTGYKVLRDNTYIDESLSVEGIRNSLPDYENSVGENAIAGKNGSQRAQNKYEIFMEPIGTTLKTIDTNGYNFEKNRYNKDTNLQVKKIWTNFYTPPEKNGKIAQLKPNIKESVFIPRNKEHDVYGIWDTLPQKDDLFYGPDSLRDGLLRTAKDYNETIYGIEEVREKYSKFIVQKALMVYFQEEKRNITKGQIKDIVKKYNVINYDYLNNYLLEVDRLPTLKIEKYNVTNALDYLCYRYEDGNDNEKICENLIRHNLIANFCLIVKAGNNNYTLYILKENTDFEYRFKYVPDPTFKKSLTINDFKTLKPSSDFKELTIPDGYTTVEGTVAESFPDFGTNSGKYYYVKSNDEKIWTEIKSDFIVYTKSNQKYFSFEKAQKNSFKASGETIKLAPFKSQSELSTYINLMIEKVKDSITDKTPPKEVEAISNDAQIGKIFYVENKNPDPKDEEELSFMFPEVYNICNISLKNEKVLYKNKLCLISGYVYEDITNNHVYGLKPLVLDGNIFKDQDGDEKYYLNSLDEHYYGIYEKDDVDNYIRNNVYREVHWNILKNCKVKENTFIYDNNYNLKDGSLYPYNFLNDCYITRPIKENTDKMVDDYIAENSQNHTNDSNLADNLIDEIFNNEIEIYNFMGNVEQ